MRYAITVDVDVPRDELVTLVDDPVALPSWHDDLVRADVLPDLDGGAVPTRTRLVYDIRGQRVEAVETVVERHLPAGMTVVTAVNGSCAETRHEFEALGTRTTRWTQHVDYAFTGCGLAGLGAMMPGALARRTRRQMRALKLHAECVAGGRLGPLRLV